MRVAFVLNSLGAGGTERSTAVLLPRLRDLGIDPLVVCLLHRDEGDEQQVRDAGFDVRILRAGGTAGRVRELRGLLLAERPDVVHTAIWDADLAGRLAAARTGLPVLCSLVNTPYAPARLADPNVTAGKLRVLREVDSATARTLVTHFHAVTEGVARDAERTLRIPRRRITVVERGRDPDALGRRDPARRAAARAALGVTDADELVVAVGRQEHQKAHPQLVEAVARLAPTRPRLVLAIAGRAGNASAELATTIERLGMADRVRLLGHRDDVADLLAAADVFAMPSWYEGTAGAAIEALALEAPVVASDLVGTEGVLVDGENAVLVPPARPGLLADAIAAVLEDREGAARRAARGRSDFEARFTLDRSAERMAALYADVAGQRRRARGGTQATAS